MIGPICRPYSQEASTDAFSFGAADMHAQSLRNMMVLATLPWMAMWAVGAEMAVLSLGKTGH